MSLPPGTPQWRPTVTLVILRRRVRGHSVYAVTGPLRPAAILLCAPVADRPRDWGLVCLGVRGSPVKERKGTPKGALPALPRRSLTGVRIREQRRCADWNGVANGGYEDVI